jgi:hypothetical protein
VSESVSCYRIELGKIFQKLVESYNSILLQQFEAFFRTENDKEKELAFKIAE